MGRDGRALVEPLQRLVLQQFDLQHGAMIAAGFGGVVLRGQGLELLRDVPRRAFRGRPGDRIGGAAGQLAQPRHLIAQRLQLRRIADALHPPLQAVDLIAVDAGVFGVADHRHIRGGGIGPGAQAPRHRRVDRLPPLGGPRHDGLVRRLQGLRHLSRGGARHPVVAGQAAEGGAGGGADRGQSPARACGVAALLRLCFAEWRSGETLCQHACSQRKRARRDTAQN
jgi:hypothetical protein